jgi:hypothetical protein
MIDRRKEDFINSVIDKRGIVHNFYFDAKEDEDGRKIARAIFADVKNLYVVAEALIQQLYDELKRTCRTELVEEVWIDVSDVYYPQKIQGSSPRPCQNSDGDINMNFYTDYLIEKTKIGECVSWCHFGFYCPTTIGRFNRKQKQFTEVSNSMLSKCELM